MRTRGNTLRTAGSFTRKQEGALAKPPAKGYRPTWAVDQVTDGLEQMGGREEGAPAAGTVAPVRPSHGRQRELASVRENKAYGPRFANLRAPGEREGEGELAMADTAAGEEGRGGSRHGRRHGAHGRTRIRLK